MSTLYIGPCPGLDKSYSFQLHPLCGFSLVATKCRDTASPQPRALGRTLTNAKPLVQSGLLSSCPSKRTVGSAKLEGTNTR